MMKILIALLIVSFASPLHAQATDGKTREFLISAGYGTLVGALVGAASLAFEDEPEDEMQKIAKGASLGLYAGIILGIYVTQFYYDEVDNDLGKEPQVNVPAITVIPLISKNGVEGISSQFRILEF